jgi:hypothetical protein
LGAEPWKDLWPRAIYPGEVPSNPPVALRIISDVQITWDSSQEYSWSYLFPGEIYLLSGGSLGDGIGFFVEAEWEQDEGIDVVQAKVLFQDPLPFLPERSLNIWVGKQSLYLLTMGERQIDRAARQRLLWSEFAISDLLLRNPANGDSLRSLNDLEPRSSQAAIELNGLLGRRAYYAIGVSQGTTELRDNNDRKDFYYRLRYKLGGLALDGTYDRDGGPVLGTGGQLFDRSLVVEHFGYFGVFPFANGSSDRHYTLGAAARWYQGPADIGIGYSWGKNGNPWGLNPALEATHWSAFAKAEYFVYPWLAGSLKLEQLETSVPEEVRELGYAEGTLELVRIAPGLVALVRQNIRGVIEAELYSRHSPSAEAGLRSPQNVWLRLDVAF